MGRSPRWQVPVPAGAFFFYYAGGPRLRGPGLGGGAGW